MSERIPCHVCEKGGHIPDVLPWYLGEYDGQPVHRWAHRACSRELRRRWQEFVNGQRDVNPA